MELKIKGHVCIQKPISVEGLKLDKTADGKKELYVNKIGETLTKIQLQKAEYKWVNEKTGQEETGKSYKSLKGKPVAAFAKTKEVADVDIIDNADRNSYIENEKTYQLISDSLKAELKELCAQNKTMSFKYVNSGFKIHRAVLELWNDKIIMRCFRGRLDQVDLSEDIIDEVKAQDEGVERLSLDALEV